jgi:hypothetical protein
MILVALAIGLLVVVAAYRNSQRTLGTALTQDIPAFITWAAAIFAIGAIGFIPGLKPVSRALLALVMMVVVLRNYQAVLSGFKQAWSQPPAGQSAQAKWEGGSGSGGGDSMFAGLGGGMGGGLGGGTGGIDINTVAAVAGAFA